MNKPLLNLLIPLQLIWLLSCGEQFLDQQPIGAIGDELLSNAEGIQTLLIGAYTPLNEGALVSGPDMPGYGVIHGAECYPGSGPNEAWWLTATEFSLSPGESYLRSFWRNYYDYISRCNQVLRILPDVKDLPENKKKTIEAEARYLRAHYYFLLKINFKNIPWIDETVTDERVSNTDQDGNYVNCWPRIAADMDYARKILPETQTDLGRPNRWAADCYYAKILIYRACEGEYPEGFSEALDILTDAIQNGITSSGDPYELAANFHDNFNCTTENGPEFVWGVQCSVNDGTPITGSGSVPNGDRKSIFIQSRSKTGPGLGREWGYYQPTPWYADHFRTDADGLPYLDMYDTNPDRLKDDYGVSPAPLLPEPDFFEPDTMGVDPRLDWTITRRGIPCLDYGNSPGSTWIPSQFFGGPYITKKWYIWKSEDGIFTPPGRPFTAMNIPVIRFADVLLMAAECEARTGSLDRARDLVNQVRQRMIDNAESPFHWVKKLSDPAVFDSWSMENAANYRIGVYPEGGPKDPFRERSTALEAILFERTLELGTEGQRFYDVVRFGKGQEIFNEFIQTEKIRFDYISEALYTDVPDAYLPIPRDVIEESKINNVPTITQNPGY